MKKRYINDESLSNRIMKYVERKYKMKESSRFKFYFINKIAGIKISFNDIVNFTGEKKTYVFNTVTRIKEDVIIKFKLEKIK